MTFDQQLSDLADRYRAEGYEVAVRPGPDDLPDFARAFVVQLCCRRTGGGVLVAAFPDRQALAADPRIPRYAEVTGATPGWRFDLAILGPEQPQPDPVVGDARDLPADQIEASVGTAERVADMGFAREGLVAAWGAMEAAARLLLRLRGEPVKWNTPWREMASTLYTSGMVGSDEFDRLLDVYQMRNRIAHGFTESAVDTTTVRFVATLARRFRTESATGTAVTV